MSARDSAELVALAGIDKADVGIGDIPTDGLDTGTRIFVEDVKQSARRQLDWARRRVLWGIQTKGRRNDEDRA